MKYYNVIKATSVNNFFLTWTLTNRSNENLNLTVKV